MLARDARARVRRVLERFPARLQENALLRVHVARLARRQIEELRIELGETVDEAAPFRIAAARADRTLPVLVVEAVERPALRRNLGDAVAPAHQVVPERVEIARLRVAPADADDRDRLVPRRPRPLDARRRARRHAGRRA
ncbi:putative polyketide synthase, type I [Burkholderia pseudomallei]|nr:putative polyketide synthase, type I [Burkholderia pseudomallei]